MADIITQLQDRLDQLNTQLYASLRYISTHHSTSPLPPPSTTTLSNAPQQQEQQQQNNHISPSSSSFPPAAAAAAAAAPPSPALPNGQTAAPAAAAAQQSPPPVAGPTATTTTTTTTTTTALEQQQQQQQQQQEQSQQQQQQQQQQQDAQPSFKITDLDPEQRPDSPATFAAAQRELAHDLVIKTRQIEELIHGIVGVERGREEQEGRISVLEEDLRGAIEERERVEREKGEWVGRMEGLICSVRR